MSSKRERVPAWYERADHTAHAGERGLRFACTSCGNCCSGQPGFVRFSREEGAALASRLGLDEQEFLDRYTHQTVASRSLNERPGPRGHDCVLLDRDSVPGKALCAVYEDRPLQCRTWPFWPENLRSRESWERAGRSCPGIDTGRLHAPELVRLSIEQMLDWET